MQKRKGKKRPLAHSPPRHENRRRLEVFFTLPRSDLSLSRITPASPRHFFCFALSFSSHDLLRSFALRLLKFRRRLLRAVSSHCALLLLIPASHPPAFPLRACVARLQKRCASRTLPVRPPPRCAPTASSYETVSPQPYPSAPLAVVRRAPPYMSGVLGAVYRAIYFLHFKIYFTKLLLFGDRLVVALVVGLLDEIPHRLLQVVDSLPHLVDAGDDAVGHLLETRLHL